MGIGLLVWAWLVGCYNLGTVAFGGCLDLVHLLVGCTLVCLMLDVCVIVLFSCFVVMLLLMLCLIVV